MLKITCVYFNLIIHAATVSIVPMAKWLLFLANIHKIAETNIT